MSSNNVLGEMFVHFLSGHTSPGIASLGLAATAATAIIIIQKQTYCIYLTMLMLTEVGLNHQPHVHLLTLELCSPQKVTPSSPAQKPTYSTLSSSGDLPDLQSFLAGPVFPFRYFDRPQRSTWAGQKRGLQALAKVGLPAWQGMGLSNLACPPKERCQRPKVLK